MTNPTPTFAIKHRPSFTRDGRARGIRCPHRHTGSRRLFVSRLLTPPNYDFVECATCGAVYHIAPQTRSY
jgi:hypothetical protein